MDQIKINVTQPPGLILSFGHCQGVVMTVVVVPQLGGNEYILSLDYTRINGSANTFSRCGFVLVVIGTVEESVSFFNCLEWGLF
jgi:hypothetical protein